MRIAVAALVLIASSTAWAQSASIAPRLKQTSVAPSPYEFVAGR